MSLSLGQGGRTRAEELWSEGKEYIGRERSISGQASSGFSLNPPTRTTVLGLLVPTLHPVKGFRPGTGKSRRSGSRIGGINAPETATLFLLRFRFRFAFLSCTFLFDQAILYMAINGGGSRRDERAHKHIVHPVLRQSTTTTMSTESISEMTATSRGGSTTASIPATSFHEPSVPKRPGLYFESLR
jgi:hypothetical protein